MIRIRFFALIACLVFPPIALSADVREIDLTGVKLGRPTIRPDKLSTIKSAEDLEKIFPQKDAVDQIKKQVNFDGQNLLIITWAGSSKDTIGFASNGDRVTFTIKSDPTGSLRLHFHLFAVPKNASMKVETGKSKPLVSISAEDVKEVDLKEVKFGLPKGRPDKLTEIKSIEDLAKIFPQKDVLDSITKQVNFDKQDLLFVLWAGSSQDKISFACVNDEVVFNIKSGRTFDLRPHVHLFAIPKDAWFRLE